MLRNLAIKSAKKNDIDIANSCITGLFKILIFLLKGHDIFGLPFRIKINSNKENKTDTKEKLKNKNNNHINNNNNNNDKTAIIFSSSKKDINTIIITIKPKEERLNTFGFIYNK